MSQTFAPWTDEQVAALNRWQRRGDVHPFTCDNGSHVLVATNQGWICPKHGCDYRQNWAHVFMAVDSQPAGPPDETLCSDGGARWTGEKPDCYECVGQLAVEPDYEALMRKVEAGIYEITHADVRALAAALQRQRAGIQCTINERNQLWGENAELRSQRDQLKENRDEIYALWKVVDKEKNEALEQRDQLAASLTEAVGMIEGRLSRSPFLAVDDWKRALTSAGEAGKDGEG